jgi:hypothetical protein
MPTTANGVPKPEPQHALELGLWGDVTTVQVGVARHDPRGGDREAEVEEPVPRREEAPERPVLQVDVVPPIQEQSEDQGAAEQCADEVFFHSCQRVSDETPSSGVG